MIDERLHKKSVDREQKSHKKYQKDHFASRLKERYALKINNKGMKRLKTKIMRRKANFLLDYAERSVVEVEYNKYLVLVVFDWKTKSLVTALPPNKPFSKEYLDKY